MEGKHVHPSTLYPGGVGTVPSVQLFSDYLIRLMKYVAFMLKIGAIKTRPASWKDLFFPNVYSLPGS